MNKRFILNALIKSCLLIISLGLFSCARMASGRYIQLKPGENLNSIAKKFKIPKEILLSENDAELFKPGGWVFIPKNIGILSDYGKPGRRGQIIYRQAFSKNKGRFIWPVPSSKKISSSFGWRKGKFHDGIDIPAVKGSHILAVDAGKVIFSGWVKGYGRLTIVSHKGDMYSIYAHASKNYTKKGASVVQGQVIAKVGNTGRSSGPHLHFELRHFSRSMNPIPLIYGTNRRVASRSSR